MGVCCATEPAESRKKRDTVLLASQAEEYILTKHEATLHFTKSTPSRYITKLQKLQKQSPDASLKQYLKALQTLGVSTGVAENRTAGIDRFYNTLVEGGELCMEKCRLVGILFWSGEPYDTKATLLFEEISLDGANIEVGRFLRVFHLLIQIAVNSVFNLVTDLSTEEPYDERLTVYYHKLCMAAQEALCKLRKDIFDTLKSETRENFVRKFQAARKQYQNLITPQGVRVFLNSVHQGILDL